MRVDNLRMKVLGLVAFTAICLLTMVYLFQLAGGRIRLDEPYQAKTLVPDALNVVAQSDVRREGIKIGRVTDIQPRGGASEISFEIEDEDEDELFQDATVRVRTKTLVGESYLDIDPGTSQAGALRDGATIPLESAAETVPLERILSSLDAPTRQAVRQNLKGIGVGLDGNGDDLNRVFGAARPTVASGGRLLRALEPQKRQLARLIGNTGAVLEALSERTASYRGLVLDARRTAAAAASRDAKLRESFEELPATLDRAKASVDKLGGFSGRATPVFATLKTAATDLSPAVRDLGPAARDARTLFRELRPFLKAVDPLLDELSPASTQLKEVIGPLDALLRQAGPALSYLKPYEKEFGSWFANSGSLTSAGDAYGAKGRVFGMIGPEVYAAYPTELRKLVDAFVETGGLGRYYGTKTNAYPKPGSLTDLKPFDGTYPKVQEGP